MSMSGKPIRCFLLVTLAALPVLPAPATAAILIPARPSDSAEPDPQ